MASRYRFDVDTARSLVRRARRCGRPLVGAEAAQADRKCSKAANLYSPACDYHETEEEHYAGALARTAFRQGFKYARLHPEMEEPDIPRHPDQSQPLA